MVAEKSSEPKQAEVNIGLIGHVDHGKTSLVQRLTGKWTDTFSEELKRGISIRLGYADTDIRKCVKCKGTDAFNTEKTCPNCKSKSMVVRRVSFVDAPGHETLMATMISGAALFDGAVLVIAANEKCPQPQTEEHLEAMKINGTKNIVIAQNKIDLVSKEQALKNYKEIDSFLKSKGFDNTPIIPIAANLGVNVDLLLEVIEEKIPTPKRDLTAPALLFVARSFDINSPGTKIKNLKGGVIGGTLIQGELKIGDALEILPGDQTGGIVTKVTSLNTEAGNIKSAHTGGLLGIGTTLDPSSVKSDKMKGQVAGKPGSLPPVKTDVELDMTLIERRVDKSINAPIKMNETLVIASGTAFTTGIVTSSAKNKIKLRLTRPLVIDKGQRVVISRKVGMRWRLSGYGESL